jgi:predicted ATPase
MLLDPAARRGFVIWEVCGRCFEAVLLTRSRESGIGLPLLRAALAELRKTGFAAHLPFILGLFAEALGDAGSIAEGAAAVDEALARCEAGGDRWFIAELLRIKGQLALRQEAVAAAEEYFLSAIAWARRQDALCWELRAATQAAQLCRRTGRSGRARELLEPVCRRFTEGLELPDLKAARSVLQVCGASS